jgi:putative transposase
VDLEEIPQLTSSEFTGNINKCGLRLNLGTVVDCYDNAIIESFWARTQTKLLDRKKWNPLLEVGADIADDIDCFHNHKRLHPSLNMLTSTKYANQCDSTQEIVRFWCQI